MIKLANIAPINVQNQAMEESSMHMILAHIDNKLYRDRFYNDNKYKLLDNGAFENGIPLSVKEMIEVGHEVRADTLVLPDFPYSDWQIGWKKIEQSIEAYRNEGFQTMFIPQSLHDDHLGLYQSIEKALEHPYIDQIGLSIIAVPNAGLERINILERYSSWAVSDKRFHMLGALDDIGGEMIECSQYEQMITGWDTSAAIWSGLHSRELERERKKFKLKVDFDSPLDWTPECNSNMRYLYDILR